MQQRSLATLFIGSMHPRDVELSAKCELLTGILLCPRREDVFLMMSYENVFKPISSGN